MRIFYILLIFVLLIPASLAYTGITSYTQLGDIPSYILDGFEINTTQNNNLLLSDDAWMSSNMSGNGSYDSHIFIFNVSQNITEISSLNSLNFTWEGYGENSSGFYTNISIWNWSNSEWYLLNYTDFNLSQDNTISVSIENDLDSFVNLTSDEIVFLVSSQKNRCTANYADNNDDTCTATLRPNANGTVNEFPNQSPADVNHYTLVDEESSDGDTSFVGGQGGGALLSHVLFRENAVLSKFSLPAPTTSYVENNYLRTTRPSDDGAWTFDDIENLQIGFMEECVTNVSELYNLPGLGVSNQSRINDVRVYATYKSVTKPAVLTRLTQMYAEINYTPHIDAVLYTDYVNLDFDISESTVSPAASTSGGYSNNYFYQKKDDENLIFYFKLPSNSIREIDVVDENDFGIKKISVETHNAINSDLIIKKELTPPENCFFEEDNIFYKGYSFQLFGINDVDFRKVIFEFFVDDQWILKNDIAYLKILNCNGDSFDLDNSESSGLYSFETDSFSDWYILGFKEEKISSQTDGTFEEQSLTSPLMSPPIEELNKDLVGFFVISGLVFILIVSLFYNVFKKIIEN